MSQRYNFFYFEAEFKKYLIAGNAGASTIKNYLSDLHYFFSWIANNQQITELAYSEFKDVFSHSTIRAYHSYLTSSTNSENTTTRRIATLRKFFLLCVEQRWLTANPTDEYDRKTKQDEQRELINAYQKSLEAKKYSNAELARHINVIRDLIINFREL